jgi:hypothetical protein
MRTGTMIDMLASDLATPRADLRLRTIAAAALGAGLSVGVMLLVYGARPEIAAALGSWRVVVKFAVALTLVATGAALALRLARPEAQGGWLILAPAALILAAAGLGELAVTPPGFWPRQALGANSMACLIGIPLLSALPLCAILWALRDGAPGIPAQAGAAAGAMAAGIGAAIYALHCPDDSPLFLAIWYGLATAAVIAAGRLTGARLLRW